MSHRQQRADNAVSGGIFTFLGRIVPDITESAATFGVFAVASFADAGLVGSGAGESEAILLADFRIGFEASPFVAKGAFDTTTAGARGFGIAQSGAILRGNALGIYGLGD